MQAISKTIVITGASAGIGEATALAFARCGWRLILGARRVERLEELRPELEADGASEVHIFPLDVNDPASVDAFVRSSLEICDHWIDVLFNNAGLALGVDYIAAGKESDWDQMLQTNVMGLLRVTRAFLPQMITSNHGHIINMGSIASHVVYEGGGVYCATKHAVRAITKTLRLELNGTPIRVSLIEPGMVKTEFSNVRFGDDTRANAVYQGVNPLSAKDIADCVLWSAMRPPNVNIEEIIVMPIDQAAPHKINRKS